MVCRRPLAAGPHPAYNGSMRSDRRITLITATATFLALTAITVVVWAITRPDTPAPAATASASALPAGHPDISAVAPPEEAHQHETGEFERISVDELKPMVEAGAVVVIDVRSAEQYTAAHIKSSLHIPVPMIEGEIEYLPKDRLIVTYCTCPAEESSGEAALILQKRGRPAKALLGGLNAWIAAGYPTVAGEK